MVGLFSYKFNQKLSDFKNSQKNFRLLEILKKFNLYSLFGSPRWIVNIHIFLPGSLIG